jgi:hypothetical protein
MPEHLHYEDDELFNPETHHESSDVNVRAILWFAVIFVVFAVVTHVVLYGMYKQFVKMEARSSQSAAPLTQVQRAADAAVPKNQPLLQPFPTKGPQGVEVPPTSNTPATDLIDMRRSEDAALQSYGWVDKEHGVVRLPIEVAKRLAVERGALGGAPPPPAAIPSLTTTAAEGGGAPLSAAPPLKEHP